MPIVAAVVMLGYGDTTSRKHGEFYARPLPPAPPGNVCGYRAREDFSADWEGFDFSSSWRVDSARYPGQLGESLSHSSLGRDTEDLAEVVVVLIEICSCLIASA